MAQESQRSDHAGWLEAIGLPHIVRTLGFAVDPGKLGIGAVAIILTIIFGWLLDWVWTTFDAGVAEDAIPRMVSAARLDEPYDEAAGAHGIFEVWRDHEVHSVLGLLRLPGLEPALPGPSAIGETGLGPLARGFPRATRLGSLANAGYGVWWLIRYHTLYFVLFGAGVLLIWSLAGGAMSRMTAVQFARDEKLTAKQGLDAARGRLFGGYFLAPCIPLVFALIVVILMAIGGAVLRIPVLGDVVCGLAFCLAILGGFVVAALLLGLAVGGSLLWPTVATEGSDAFDAFSRSLSYVFSKPWKTVVYALLATVYAAICWWFVRSFTFGALVTTRTIVGFGTSPFGWWSRGGEGESINKLDLIWPLGGPNAFYAWPPDWSALSWYEYISAVLIAGYVLLVVALMWSFLASFYYSASTVVYMLLRRDVDGTDLTDVYFEEPEGRDVEAPGTHAPTTGDVSTPAAPEDPEPSRTPPSTAPPVSGVESEAEESPPGGDKPDTSPDNEPGSESSPDSSDRLA